MPRIIFQSAVFLEGRREVVVQLPQTYEADHLELVLDAFGIGSHHASNFYISCNGRIIDEDDVLRSGISYRLSPRLRGGKGGFGSMLRAIGAQIEKTTSREACRDLSGRRMRDVNNEKKLKDWVSKQADREREKIERKRERRERQKAVPEHKFSDRQYDEQKMVVKENLEDALQQGLQRQAAVPLDGNRKRKSEEEEPDKESTKRRAAEWLGLNPDELKDLGSSSEDSDLDEAYPLPFAGSDRVGSSAGSNMSTAVQFSDNDSKVSSEWENPDQFVEMENGDACFEPVHSDELLERMGESSSEKGEYSKSDAGSIRSERGECSKSDAGSVRSERGECSRSEAGSVPSEKGECSKSDAGSYISDLSHVDYSKSNQGSVKMSHETKESTTEELLPLVLEDYEKPEDLHAYGLERLKDELMSRGLKCGGTLEQRAERLYSIKGLSRDEYPPSIMSKGGKSKSSQR